MSEEITDTQKISRLDLQLGACETAIYNIEALEKEHEQRKKPLNGSIIHICQTKISKTVKRLSGDDS